jgi:hypothetical protein
LLIRFVRLRGPYISQYIIYPSTSLQVCPASSMTACPLHILVRLQSFPAAPRPPPALPALSLPRHGDLSYPTPPPPTPPSTSRNSEFSARTQELVENTQTPSALIPRTGYFLPRRTGIDSLRPRFYDEGCSELAEWRLLTNSRLARPEYFL